jgi:hypothetical protein
MSVPRGLLALLLLSEGLLQVSAHYFTTPGIYNGNLTAIVV